MRLKNGWDLMLDEEFLSADFKQMKSEIGENIEQLNREELMIDREWKITLRQ